MKKSESAKIASNGRVKIFIDTYDAMLILITLYATVKTSFLLHLSQLKDAVDKQVEDIKMWAETKRTSKKNLGNIIIKFATRASVQADQLHLDEIMLALTKPLTYITKASGEIALSRARDLLKVMVDNNAQLTIIQAADITAMDEAIKKYDSLVNMPKIEIESRKAEGTSRIAAIQKEVDKDKADIGKIVYSFLPDLTESFNDAARIGQAPGTRKLRLVIHVADAVGGSSLRKADCYITNGIKSFTTKTGKGGIAKFFGLENGLWNVVIRVDNYPIFKQDEVTIDSKKIVKMEVSLKKNALPDKTVGSFVITVYGMKSGKKLGGVKLTIPSIEKSYMSEEMGIIKGDGLVVATYAAFLSGDRIVGRPISFSIDAGKTFEGSFGVEEIIE